MKNKFFPPILMIIIATLACGKPTPTPAPINRLNTIPANIIKGTPANDLWPPIAHEGWSQPVPLPYPVNTGGGEDSPFILPDDQTLYFFFTPDVVIPAEKQLLDGVTGIWVTHHSGEAWSEPERVRLSDPGKLALDGCEFVLGDLLYFCTAREGYIGIQWFSAELKHGLWQDWRFAGDELKQSEFEVGELHITADGQQLYFASKRPGGFGGFDLWVSMKSGDGWSDPVNLGPTVNTTADENRPFVTADRQELWFDSVSGNGRPGPAVYLSKRQSDGSWGSRQEIISTFAGEPTLSGDGTTLYFIHHYYSADLKQMLEADIYVTTRPGPTPATAATQFGVAGLIPRNFPHASAADWTNLYETLPETGSLLGVYTPWSDSPEKAGEIPSVVSTVYGLADRYDFIPVIALGFFNDMPDGSLQASIRLDDPGERALFQKAALAIVEKYHPPYLGLGVEVNRYFEAAPSDFENYLTLYTETYDAVKTVSPQTKVFAIFQLEMLKGNGFLMGNSENRSPQWELLSRFDDWLDLAAFTTYPFLDFQLPADLPEDYYTEIAAHTDKPVAFTEIGWPSAPLTSLPDSAFGGSEDEQAGFVRRFFDLTSGLHPALALWSFPHDLGEAGPAIFNSVSLRYNNGTPKPALAEWQAMRQK